MFVNKRLSIVPDKGIDRCGKQSGHSVEQMIVTDEMNESEGGKFGEQKAFGTLIV